MVRGRYWLELADNNFAVFAAWQPLYVLLYASAIIFFCFFYTALVFNPRETADNLKKSGAFVPEFVRESKRRSISIK